MGYNFSAPPVSRGFTEDFIPRHECHASRCHALHSRDAEREDAENKNAVLTNSRAGEIEKRSMYKYAKSLLRIRTKG